MDSRSDPRGHPRNHQRDDAYRRALDECTRVAREEFSVASRALQTAVVRVSRQEVRCAIGRRGSNVSLASRLLGIRIKVISEESNAHG
jgi:transcription antitermination factor NusA-like protein